MIERFTEQGNHYKNIQLFESEKFVIVDENFPLLTFFINALGTLISMTQTIKERFFFFLSCINLHKLNVQNCKFILKLVHFILNI